MARAGGRGERGQFLHLGGVERVAARRIDQHRRAVLAAGQGAAEGDRMAGDDQADAEQPGEGGKLLGGAGTLAVRGDHHRRDAGHHQAGRQTGNGQCLAGARRADQQQRRLARSGRAANGIALASAVSSSPCCEGGVQRGGDAMEVERGEAGGVRGASGGSGGAVRSSGSSAAVTSTPSPRRRVARISASSPSSARTCAIACAIAGARKSFRRMAALRGGRHIVPTVRIRARGWISACASTGVLGRMRSTIARTWPRMPPEVSSTGVSPARGGGIERGAQLLHEVLQLAAAPSRAGDLPPARPARRRTPSPTRPTA